MNTTQSWACGVSTTLEAIEMRIEQDRHGYTIKNDKGGVMLKGTDRKPMYCACREDVKDICRSNGLYERTDGVLVAVMIKGY